MPVLRIVRGVENEESRVSPEPTLLIQPFEISLPRDAPIVVTGRTVANLLSDAIEGIEDDAREARFNIPVGKGQSAPELSRLELPTAAVQVGAFSPEQVVGAWNWIRQQQHPVSGDLFFAAGKLTLRAKIAGRRVCESAPFSSDEMGLRQAVLDLAQRLMSDFRPDIMALSYIRRSEWSFRLGWYTVFRGIRRCCAESVPKPFSTS